MAYGGDGLAVLVLEDDDVDAQLICRELRDWESPGEVVVTDNQKSFERTLVEFASTVVLADYRLPTFDGLTTLSLVPESKSDLTFIFVSGTIGEELAIQALQAGATDYILKSRLSSLVPAVQRAVSEYHELLHSRETDAELQVTQAHLRQAVNAAHLGLRATRS